MTAETCRSRGSPPSETPNNKGEGDGMTLMPVAAYCRCSTDKQELSIPAQKKAILQFAEESGCEVIDWYEDQGKSGTKAEGRPAFLRLIEKVQGGSHGYSAILVYDIDRWGRFVDSEYATFYRVLCKQHGAPVRFVVDGSMINRGDIGSQVTMTVKQVVATEESRKRSEIVYERSVQNAQRGFSSGGYPPHGYSRMLYESDGRPIGILPPGKRKNEKSQKVGWVPDRATAPTVIRIFDLYARQGIGVKRILHILNEERIPSPRGGMWGVQSVATILDNPTYIGARVYGKSIRGAFQQIKTPSRKRGEWVQQPGAHDAIIDPKLFELTRERRREMAALSKDKTRLSSLRNGTFLLSPYLICRDCGLRFHGVSQYGGNGKLYRRYVDGSYESRGPSTCSRFAIPRDPLEESVLGILNDLVSTEVPGEILAKAIQEELVLRDNSAGLSVAQYRTRLTEVDTRIKRIKDAILDGFSADDFRAEFANLQRQRQALVTEQKRAEASVPSKERLAVLTDRALTLMSEIRRAISENSRRELKLLIGRVVDKIEIDKARLKANLYLRPISAVASGCFGNVASCASERAPTSGIDPQQSSRTLQDPVGCCPDGHGVANQCACRDPEGLVIKMSGDDPRDGCPGGTNCGVRALGRRDLHSTAGDTC